MKLQQPVCVVWGFNTKCKAVGLQQRELLLPITSGLAKSRQVLWEHKEKYKYSSPMFYETGKDE